MELVLDSSTSSKLRLPPLDEVGGTAAAGGGAGPPDGTVLLFTIRPCNENKIGVRMIDATPEIRIHIL